MNYTIKDIAKMAGVAPSTVSKIINNYGGISEKTKKKVNKVIEDTGYQPTFSAKSLATKKSNLIGLIYAGKINVDFTHPFFNEVVTSFKNTIGLLGYDIIMFSNEHFYQDKGSYLARCRHFQVDGCLIIAGEEIEKAIYELVENDIPCMGIDLELKGTHSSYVMTDNVELANKVVQHLHTYSVKDIAFIGGKQDSAIAMLRKKGFLQAMNQLGLEVREEWIQYGDFYEKSGYDAMKKILEKRPYPQAIFAASDLMAFGALKAIEEIGIKVPDDIRLIGCDDIVACRYSNPKLTTVKQDKEMLGKTAACILDSLISGEKMDPVFIESELIVRDSCGSNND
ncbi:LacI family DNA-binding transcriptional regulator [Lederbergia lenta]|uniref:LacI family transcriptional regulator n=1 Tax=Lederbergia lenta TaxID=1467 RepID=A0A2X4VLC6_LEDLE|nr:LacI family DNA-binding transcriptional regulator [Lederbergia lenta]MCM3112647.1 LacI family transcriptional regulator [Lederbergia lenta]MEC2323686.1 LacI family DNA-binding transcriptional regulator [Lederbergia lenta]SQI51631.1 LacI family transcriptional regulator [Lederbergia lenta]